MDWIHFEISGKSLLSPIEQPYFLNQQPPPPPYPTSLQSNGLNLNNKVSPSIILIIIILAIIFFVSGLLHLLVRFLLRPPSRDPDDLDSVTALQGQLQQLFHLHDAGVDQSYIDTLPVFSYKAIIGVKMDPFDCAVCLCEFEGEDKLRLLPKCSHAFHMECIDTWLLSHSTCPLCRASLLPDFSANHHGCSPIVFVLESGSNESSREIVPDREASSGGGAVAARVGSHLSARREDDEFGLHLSDLLSKSREIQPKEIENSQGGVDSGEKVVLVKLGKFKNLDCVGEGSSNNNNSSSSSSIDSRRCFSMGSFAYVMEENTSLHVPIRATPLKKQSSKKPCLPLTPGHRPAMSECGGCDSRRYYFNGGGGLEALKILELQNCGNGNGNGSICTNGNDNNKAIQCSRRESFSVSKIWLREKDRRPNSAKVDSSRRAFSFRFPLQQNVVPADDQKSKNGDGGDGGGGGGGAARRTVSEICVGSWENGGSEWGACDEEVQSCNSLDSQPNAPSFARRTLLWLMGRPNKVVHSTFSSNV